MNFDFLEDPHEARAFALSLGVILLSIIAVAAYAAFRGGWVFYLFGILAILLGFYMAYHISKKPPASQPAAGTAGKKARKR